MRRYFSNLFIAVVFEPGICRLMGRELKNKKVIKTFEASFENPKKNFIDEKIISYIQEKSKKLRFVYVTFLLDTIEQGAIVGTKKEDFHKQNLNIKDINHVAIDKNWSIYSLKSDTKHAKKIFEPVKLDLIYSPFLLLHKCLNNHPKKQSNTLYIYYHKTFIANGIFEDKKLVFASFFKIPDEEIQASPATYNHIKNSIKEFYNDPRCKNTFLENIVIFGDEEMDFAITNMIKNELMMNVSFEKVNTLDLLCDLAQKDVF